MSKGKIQVKNKIKISNFILTDYKFKRKVISFKEAFSLVMRENLKDQIIEVKKDLKRYKPSFI